MKRRYIPILVAVVLSSVAATSCKNAEAQVKENDKLYYPLAFGDDTLNLRQDKMTRVYIPPKKVLWSQGNVHDLENLLNADDGQADLVNASSCYMKSTNEEGASIILDYGRELHGALKLVVGSGSAADFKMRIRLGESVSETCSEISGGTAVLPGSGDRAGNERRHRRPPQHLPRIRFLPETCRQREVRQRADTSARTVQAQSRRRG